MKRNRYIDKNIFIEVLMTFVTSLCILICFVSASISSDNTNYAIEQLHEYDNFLFVNNPSFSTGEFSPRFFMNFIFTIFMKALHLKWENVAVFFIYLGVVITAIGIVNTVFRLIDNKRIFYAVILTIFVAKGITSGLSGWSTFVPGTIGLGTGFAFSILAISYVLGENKRWNIAWIIIAISMLMHVHEGIWGFCALFLLWIIECIINRKIQIKDLKTIWIFVIVAAICIIPSMRTDTSALTDAKFVYIYANQRTPHHLLPSYWGKKSIIQYFLILVYPVVLYVQCLYFKNRKAIKNFIIKASLCLVAWCGALVITYVFTEIFPTSLIVTMYVTKFFKYISLLAMIWYIKILYTFIEDNKTVMALMVSAFAMVAVNAGIMAPILFVVLLSLIYYMIKYDTKLSECIGMLFIIVEINWFNNLGIQLVAVVLGIIMLLAIFQLNVIKKLNNTKKYILAIGWVIGILALSLYGKLYIINNSSISVLNPKDYLIASSTQDVYDLAELFSENTKKDDVFLADPGSESDAVGWLQVISRRSCYVLWKTTPASKGSIEEWYERYLKVKGISNFDVHKVFNLMNEEGIRYILIDSRQYEKYDESDLFEIYLEAGEDSYRIYKLSTVQ
ncbi:DUF6798 domain-containing protein [Clostridium gelidum]|nr:DUF6798 domain-containing protein [Clostridium gelidum]